MVSIDLDEESLDNSIHDNTILGVSDPEDALGIEEDAQNQNALYSNIVVNDNN